MSASSPGQEDASAEQTANPEAANTSPWDEPAHVLDFTSPEEETEPGRAGPFELVARYPARGQFEVFLAYQSSIFGVVRTGVVRRANRRSPVYAELRDRLLEELEALSRIDHPNIVRVLDAGEDEKGTYLALEHVDGTTLAEVNAQLRSRSEALPFELASHIAIEILRGLHALHSARRSSGELMALVHRDVSPANVLIQRTGHIRLTGLSSYRRRVRPDQPPRLGRDGYSAPEVIRGARATAAGDLYGVGMLLFELLMGRPCFSGTLLSELHDRIAQGLLRLERLEREGVPSELCELVAFAAQPDADARFSSAEEMANAIETWILRSNYQVSPWILAAFFRQHHLFDLDGDRPVLLRKSPLKSIWVREQKPSERDLASELGLGSDGEPLPGAPEITDRLPAPVVLEAAAAPLPQVLEPLDLPTPSYLNFEASEQNAPPGDQVPVISALDGEGSDPFDTRTPPTPIRAESRRSYESLSEAGGPGDDLDEVGRAEPTEPGRPPNLNAPLPPASGRAAPVEPPRETKRSVSDLLRSSPGVRDPVRVPVERAPAETGRRPSLPGVSPVPRAAAELMALSEDPAARGARPTEDALSAAIDRLTMEFVESPAPVAEWKGELKKVTGRDVLRRLVALRATGVVEFLSGPIWKKLTLRLGRPYAITSNVGMEFIGEHLIRGRIVDRGDLDRAQRESTGGEEALLLYLVRTGRCTTEVLELHLGENVRDRLLEVISWSEGSFEFTPSEPHNPPVRPAFDLTRWLDEAEPARRAAEPAPQSPSLSPEPPSPNRPTLRHVLEMARQMSGSSGKGRVDDVTGRKR